MRTKITSSHTTLAILLSGERIPPSRLNYLDFPPEFQSELRRALAHKPAHDLVVTFDEEERLINVETRNECRTWLSASGCFALAKQVKAAQIQHDELLCLAITPSETGLRTLQLSAIMAPEEPIPPAWQAF